MTGRLFHVAKKVRWLIYAWYPLAAVLAVLTLLMLWIGAGDAAKVPQTRTSWDVPVLIDGVAHLCDFSITSDSDSRDTASATCEESP